MIFWNTENVLCNLLFIIFKIDLSFYFLLFPPIAEPTHHTIY